MSAAENLPSIESPCNKVCTVDSVSGLCIGCGRNLNEIASWLSYDADERTRIIAELPQRLAGLRQPGAGETG